METPAAGLPTVRGPGPGGSTFCPVVSRLVFASPLPEFFSAAMNLFYFFSFVLIAFIMVLIIIYCLLFSFVAIARTDRTPAAENTKKVKQYFCCWFATFFF